MKLRWLKINHGQIQSGQKNKSGQTESLDITGLQAFCGQIFEKPIIIKKIKKINQMVKKLKN